MLNKLKRLKNTCHISSGDTAMDVAWEHLITTPENPEHFGIEDTEEVKCFAMVFQAGCTARIKTIESAFKNLFKSLGAGDDIVDVQRKPNNRDLFITINTTLPKGRALAELITTSQEDFKAAHAIIRALKSSTGSKFKTLFWDYRDNSSPERKLIVMQNKFTDVSAGKIQEFLNRHGLEDIIAEQIDNLPQRITPWFDQNMLEKMCSLKLKGSNNAFFELFHKLKDYSSARLTNFHLTKQFHGMPMHNIERASAEAVLEPEQLEIA